MINWFVAGLRNHVEIAFFLTLAIGYLIGRLHVGHFSLGAVTGTLLAGVLVGQLGIRIAPEVKQCFFVLFLFSIGYRCGPQFFQGLRKNGLIQAAVAAIVATTGLAIAYIISLAFRYEPGTAGGLIAGALTESATIGTASDAISRLPLNDAARAALTNQIPVAFAVTYLIGVIGAAWFLSQVGPRLMRVDIAKACADYEKQMGGSPHIEPGVVSAYRDIEIRAYLIREGTGLTGRPVRDIFPGLRIFVERVRRGDHIIDADADTVLQPGDIVAISGRRRLLVEKVESVVMEVEDSRLLHFPIEQLDVFVTNKDIAGKTVQQITDEWADKPFARGIYLRGITRHLVSIPVLRNTEILRGDVVTITGSERHIEDAVRAIGVPDRQVEATDMVFVAAGIVIGAFVGLPYVAVGKLELGLSLSVGVLLGGLLWGWFHSIRPTIGRVPTQTLWIFESLGLTGFVAVVGIAAGPDFVRGIQASGVSLIIAGIVVVLVPHLVGVLVGYYGFKMHPGLLLGVCAGAGTATPALAAIQESAKSSVPTLGYGISYAVGNVLLALWGAGIVALLS